jgi:hypothetical protein
MADRLMRKSAPSARVVGSILLALASLTAWAQAGSMPDPTRPADVQAQPDGQTAVPTAPTGLQAVVLRRHGRSVAIINGEAVAVGGKVGESRLVALTADQAVLVGPNGREVLKLAPAVAISRPSASQSRTRRTKKRISGRGDGHE